MVLEGMVDKKEQIIANVIMFIPIGVLLGRRVGWQGVFISAWISLVIEGLLIDNWQRTM